VPSSASVAEPLKATLSSVAHLSVAEGAAMAGTGAVLPAVTVRVSVSVAPCASVTRSLTVTLPPTV
jgi:hypothetical protein